MTCLAAFKMLLYGYTGQADSRVATLVANRTRQETEGLIGFLVNTVILRTDLRTTRHVGRCCSGSVRPRWQPIHQDLPFEELVRTLERERNLERYVAVSGDGDLAELHAAAPAVRPRSAQLPAWSRVCRVPDVRAHHVRYHS